MLHADPKAVQPVKFTEHLKQNATIFFILEEAKETTMEFSKGIVSAF